MNQKRNSNQNQQKPILLKLAKENAGEGRFQEEEFEQVQSQNGSQEDFGFEEEQACGKIDSEPYKKSIGLGPKDKGQPDPSLPQLHIKGYQFLWGHNSGQYTVTFLDTNLCSAVGTNIFYEKQIIQGHQFSITYLHYQQKEKVLISGTQGKCAQVRLWTRENDKLAKYGEKEKYNLPMNSLGVGFAYLKEDMLVVITRFNLHRSSQIFTFSNTTGKRAHCLCKLGKVAHLVTHNGSTYILTEKGISQLEMLGLTQCKLNLLVPAPQLSTFEMLEDKFISLGYMDGKVEFWDDGQSWQTKVHQNQILCMKTVDGGVVSAGRDGQVCVLKYDRNQRTVEKVQVIEVASACLNIHITESTVYFCLKNNQTLTYTLDQLNLKPTPPSPIQNILTSSSECTPHLLYNKYSQKYYYSLSDCSRFASLTFQQSILKGVKMNQLTRCPSRMDIAGSVIAFVHKPIDYQAKHMFKSTVKSLFGFAFKQAKINLQTLYIQDLVKNSILGEIQLPEKDNCTVIRMTDSADKLAVGYFSGAVELYNINQPQNIHLAKKCQLHASPLTELLWNQQGTIIKSISRDNLIYLDVLKDKEKLTAIVTSKGIEGAEWPNCGKYDWKTFHMWNSHLHTPDQITDVVQSYDYLLALMNNGELKVFRNPSSKEGQNLGKLFEHPYKCRIVYDDGDTLTLLVAAKGILFCLELSGEDDDLGSQRQAEDES